MTSENHAELFSRDSIVYLSPDAPESLPGTPLDASKVYVIGGLVDETVHKVTNHPSTLSLMMMLTARRYFL